MSERQFAAFKSRDMSTETEQPPSRPQRILWYGQLTTPKRLVRRGWSIVSVPASWLVLFLVLPCIVLAALAFFKRSPLGTIEWTLTYANFTRLAGWGTYGWSSDYLWIVGRSIWIAFVTTSVAILLAYPLSFFIATRSVRMRYLLLGLVMVPFCTNMVIRTYAWSLVFSSQLPLAKFAAWLG